MDKKVQSMKDAADEILFHILKSLGITYQPDISYYFRANNEGIRVVYSDSQSSFYPRPDLCGIVRAFNYIVYGR